jgi:hypothetical protein
MTINLPVGDFNEAQGGIHNPQHARVTGAGSSPLQGEINNAPGSVVMDIYTGTCMFNFTATDDQPSEDIKSLVPLGPQADGKVDIQGYPGNVQAIISASLTNFGRSPEAAYVDGAVVKLEQHEFPGVAGRINVLVIHAEIGGEDGDVHRMAYQVTVLAAVNEDTNLHSLVAHLDPTQDVPDA